MSTYLEVVDEWYEKLEAPFVNFIKSRFPLTDDDIADLYVNTYMAIYDNFQKGAVAPDTNWKSYILRIGFNQAMTLSESKGLLVHPDGISTGKDEDDTGNKWERVPALVDLIEEAGVTPEEKEKMIQVLNNCMNALPFPCNVILPDFYYNDLSLEEIKDEIGYTSVDAVKTQRYKCFNRLKTAVLGMLAMMNLSIYNDK